MKKNMLTIPVIMIAVMSATLAVEISLEEELIAKCPRADLNGDDKLTPSEIWYARTISRGQQGQEARELADKLIRQSYAPAAIDEAKTFGPAAGKKIKLFILSGQSNMVGQGLSAELGEQFLRPRDRILMFENGKWQPLRPLRHTFGPEISFADTLAEAWPGETIGVVKQAVGGTGILAWHPQWTKEDADLTGDGHKGNLWKALTDKVGAARRAADCEVMGFIWQQGGKDMRRLETGKMYLPNLKALVEGLRKETGASDLPFVLGSYRMDPIPDDLSDFDPSEFAGSSRPGGPYVLKAQYDAQRVLAPAKMIPLRDLERHPENVHYSTAGQLELGRLFAAGYQQLTSTHSVDSEAINTLTEINQRFKNVEVQIVNWPDELHKNLGKLKQYAFMAFPENRPSGKTPLLIALHGAGGKKMSLQEQLLRSSEVKGLALAELADKNLILLEPNSSDAWDPETLDTMLDYVLDHHKDIDKSRVYVMGHSMGGTGTWDWILRSAGRFAAAAPCGFRAGASTDGIEKLVKLPIWGMVGGADSKNLAGVQKMVENLRSAGNENVRHTVFPGANHAGGNAGVFSSVEWVDWMLKFSLHE